MKIVTLPPSYLEFSPENSLVSIWFPSDIRFSIFVPVILNVSSVVEVVAFFLFKISGVFYAVMREMSSDVAPTTFSVSAVLGLVTESSTMVTLSVEGVGVFLDHVLTLVGS